MEEKKVHKHHCVLYHGTDVKQKPATIYVRLKNYPNFWLGDDTTLYNDKKGHFAIWTARDQYRSGIDGWKNVSAVNLYEKTFGYDSWRIPIR
jgi:hypothetical protein